MMIWYGFKLELYESLFYYWFCLKIIIIFKIWFGYLLLFWYFMFFNVNDWVFILLLVRVIYLKFLILIFFINLIWLLVVLYKVWFWIILYFIMFYVKMFFVYYINENVFWCLIKDFFDFVFIILYFFVNFCFN